MVRYDLQDVADDRALQEYSAKLRAEIWAASDLHQQQLFMVRINTK